MEQKYITTQRPSIYQQTHFQVETELAGRNEIAQAGE